MIQFGLIKSIEKCETNPIIGEIKVYSPEFGDLLQGRDPLDILNIYEDAGMVGISYITASEYKGNFRIFKEICRETNLPVLRKDFIKTKEEIERTSEAGGSAVLLITGILGKKIGKFVDYSLKKSIEPVVEVHSLKELRIAQETNTNIIGINNRDITKLEMDNGTVEKTAKLSSFVEDDFIIISESSVRTIDDLETALTFSNVVLVGTAFMKAEDLSYRVHNFLNFKR
ncbi:MAG: indole-3-glycerol phosphate synthase TrpC [Thermoplasmatota archaeon]